MDDNRNHYYVPPPLRINTKRYHPHDVGYHHGQQRQLHPHMQQRGLHYSTSDQWRDGQMSTSNRPLQHHAMHQQPSSQNMFSPLSQYHPDPFQQAKAAATVTPSSQFSSDIPFVSSIETPKRGQSWSPTRRLKRGQLTSLIVALFMIT
jgi:hypothetical protein